MENPDIMGENPDIGMPPRHFGQESEGNLPNRVLCNPAKCLMRRRLRIGSFFLSCSSLYTCVLCKGMNRIKQATTRFNKKRRSLCPAASYGNVTLKFLLIGRLELQHPHSTSTKRFDTTPPLLRTLTVYKPVAAPASRRFTGNFMSATASTLRSQINSPRLL